MNNYLWIWLLLVAWMLKGVMDILNFDFDISIFKKWGFSEKFWNLMISWRNKRFLGTPIDGWHTVQSIMIMLISASIVLYKPVFNSNILNWVLTCSIYGVGFNLVWIFGKVKSK